MHTLTSLKEQRQLSLNANVSLRSQAMQRQGSLLRCGAWFAGLPVPTQDIVEAVQAVLGLMPPPKLAAAVQKLINCCPEARTALEEQALSSQDGRGSGACLEDFKFCFVITTVTRGNVT